MKDEYYRKWIDKLPSFNFDPSWNVKIIPPFAGAAVRFQVKRGDAHVSIYADFDSSLGYWGDDEPYWEIYPFGDDTWRCGINDTEDLLKHIELSLVEQEKAND